MVSGIGPKATLENLGIPILVERESVGQNMWDQPFLSVIQEVDVETQSGLSSPAVAAAAVAQYDANRTGILTNNGGDFIGELSVHVKIPYNETSNSCRLGETASGISSQSLRCSIGRPRLLSS
jgi:hypothetical protein